MIEKMADDLIGQMTEARLIDKDMEERYIYVFICWIEKFITVGSIIVISLAFHKLFPTIFFLVFFLELRKRTGGYHLDKYYKCYLATIVSYLVIVIISARLSEHPQWLFAILVIAITGIGLIGTVNHPNMHMTSEELMESKKSARTIVLLEGCIILGCVLLDADMVYISYGKQRKALDTGRKNVKTDASAWQRIENVHEPIIDKDTFYKTRERMEHIKKKHLEASKPKADVPNKPDNILVYKTKCACCGGSVLIGRHHTYSEKFYYKCKNRRKLARLCENKYSYDYSEVMDSVFSVIRQHMSLCVEKTKFVQKMNSRKENVLQYDIYTKQIAKLQNDVRRITANKSGLYEDYREQLITAEELCQYQREYESRVNEIEAQITELLHRRSLYEKEFHIDEGWEETVNKYMAKRKLTKELVDAFVSEIVFYDGNIEVKLLYDDFLKELLKVAEEREVSSNG